MYVGGEIADLAAIGRPADRGRHRRPARPPVAHRQSLAAVERAKGELVEALPAGGTADPQRRRSDRHPDGPADGRRGRCATGSTRRPTSAPRRSRLAGLRRDALPPRSRRPAIRDVSIPIPRPAVRPQRAGCRGGRHRRRRPAGLDAIADGPGRRLGARPTGPRSCGCVARRSSTTSYNASPGSVVAALDLLAGLPGRRVAVLGEMLELGRGPRGGPPGRRGGGREPWSTCSSSSAPTRGGIAEGAVAAGLDPRPASMHVADAEAALDALRPRLRDGDTVLVKASRGIEPRPRSWTRSALELGEAAR